MKVNAEIIEQSQLKQVVPSFRVGDQVRVALRIIEGESERIQVFEGTVIRMRGHGLSRMFTVRKISFGVGVERILPLHSPRIDKIEVVRSGHVRRAKLYFLRERSGRAARLDEKAERRGETPAVPQSTIPPSQPAAAGAPTRR